MTTTAQGSGGTRRVFDGDATVDAVLGASGLPRELQDLVRLVVSHCRLSKREKSQAAAMLCDRFAEQLDAGRTVQQITGELGEPRVVARSLSRDVRRNRSLSVRIFRRGVQGVVLCLLLLIAAYGYYFVRFNFGKPNIARNFAQEHNDRVLARPEAERAWPIYRQLLPGWKHLTYTDEEGTAGYPDLVPGTPGWDAAVANHKANAAAIETIRRAARLPVLGYPLREDDDPFIVASEPDFAGDPVVDSPASVASNPPLREENLRHLGKIQFFARTLRFDAMHAAATGDGRRVTDNIAAMLGLGAQLRDSKFLVSDLVSTAVTSRGLGTLGDILAKYPAVLSDSQLTELAALLAPAAGESNPFLVRFEMQRQVLQDILQRSYTDDGEGDGVLTAEGVGFIATLDIAPPPPGMGTSFGLATLGPLVSQWMANRAELTRYFDDAVASVERFMQLPLWERTSDLQIGTHHPGSIDRIRFWIAEILLLATDKVALGPEFALQERDAIRTAIALEQFKRARGGYPATLAELTPALLAEIPPDRYSGKPLCYGLTDGKPRLYSIGVDRIDNGGTPPASVTNEIARVWMNPARAATKVQELGSASSSGSGTDFRGDWILWPKPLERTRTAVPKPPAEPVANPEADPVGSDPSPS
jgi:hypothetical protein